MPRFQPLGPARAAVHNADQLPRAETGHQPEKKQAPPEVKDPSIRRLHSIDSTNAYARRHLDELADGEVISAEVQTDGRGRLDRKWHSGGPGNLTASFVLKPFEAAAEAPALANITQYAALAVAELIDDLGARTTLKWPNDVMANGSKIAGILSESVVQGERFLGCILGIGVNLNMGPSDLRSIGRPAASLHLLLGRPIDRDAFLDELLERFFRSYPSFLEEGFPLIRDKFKGKSTFIGKRISIDSSTSRCSGIAQDLDEYGSLVLLDDSGMQRHISVGDIR